MAVFHKIQTRISKPLNPSTLLNRYKSKLGFESATTKSFLTPRIEPKNVAIFWDLHNKPPNPFRPYEAALKLKKTASSFGVVRDMIAYANRHTLSHFPKPIREQRKDSRERRVSTQLERHHCGVCGRNFYNYDRLLNHFKQIHERENMKRLSQIESARGSRRVKLVAKYSMKMDKYKKAVREILTPKVRFGLGHELERAGFWVGNVESNRPKAVDIAMRKHMVEVMDMRRAQCLVLVSDDSGFVDVLQEAKRRCVKTVVVGNYDVNGGGGAAALKRAADSGFCWREIMMWKAKKEAVSVVGKWKDHDVLERLEWRYVPELEKRRSGLNADKDDDSDKSVETCVEGDDDDDDCELLTKSSSWWRLESDGDDMRS